MVGEGHVSPGPLSWKAGASGNHRGPDNPGGCKTQVTKAAEDGFWEALGAETVH